jgi:hypothetical protein
MGSELKQAADAKSNGDWEVALKSTRTSWRHPVSVVYAISAFELESPVRGGNVIVPKR